jgi:hypothetical protein
MFAVPSVLALGGANALYAAQTAWRGAPVASAATAPEGTVALPRTPEARRDL